MRGAVASALLLLVVSGCAAPVHPQAGPLSGATSEAVPLLPGISPLPLPDVTADPFAMAPELVGCRSFIGALRASGSSIQPLVPEGYDLDGSTAPHVVSLRFRFEWCASVILSNDTVLRDARVFLLTVDVRVDEPRSVGAQIHAYVLEVFTSHSALTHAFQAVGIPANDAEFQLDEATPVLASVKGLDGTQYEVTTAPGHPTNAPETTVAIRHHRMGADGVPLWFDYNQTYQYPSWQSPAAVDVQGGVLDDVEVGDQGKSYADAWLGDSRGIIRFVRLA